MALGNSFDLTINQGETFTKKEASEVFFAATKLFQSKDPHLRRMVYLCIKDICPGSDEVIIVTSSLMKDMNSKVWARGRAAARDVIARATLLKRPPPVSNHAPRPPPPTRPPPPPH